MTGSFALLLVLAGWALTALVLYVIVRLGVSHGMQDAARARTRAEAPQVGEVIRRQQAWYGES